MSEFARHNPHKPDTELIVCPRCDWVMRLGRLDPHERALCPRCNYRLQEGSAAHDRGGAIAWAVAALIMLVLVFAFDFLGFGTRGVGHVMSFTDALLAFSSHGYPLLTVLFMLTTAVLPGMFLAGAIYVGIAARSDRPLPWATPAARLVHHVQAWMMSDVLLVGILVSLTKIVSLASISLGPSFLLFCLFSLLLLKTMNALDWPLLWHALAGPPSQPPGMRSGLTGQAQNVLPCHVCGSMIDAGGTVRCQRCGHHDRLHRCPRLQLTAALLVTALILYIPANVYPIMQTSTLFGSEQQTIAGGVLHLLALGSWPIALIIFCASIVVPLTKIGALGWLCLCGRYGLHRDNRVQTRLFRFVEFIGRWSMIDLFVVAVLTALVQAGSLMSITPGPAAVSFAAVVLLTMIAAVTFDSRLLWRQHDTGAAPRPPVEPA